MIGALKTREIACIRRERGWKSALGNLFRRGRNGIKAPERHNASRYGHFNFNFPKVLNAFAKMRPLPSGLGCLRFRINRWESSSLAGFRTPPREPPLTISPPGTPAEYFGLILASANQRLRSVPPPEVGGVVSRKNDAAQLSRPDRVHLLKPGVMRIDQKNTADPSQRSRSIKSL